MEELWGGAVAMSLVRPAAAWLSSALLVVPCHPWPVVSLRQSSYHCHSQHLCNKLLTAVIPSISVTKFLQLTYLAPLWQKFLQLLYPSPLRQSSYDWHAKRLCDNVLLAVIQISYDWYTQHLCEKFLTIDIPSTSVTNLLRLIYPATLWQISYDCHTQHLCDKVVKTDKPSTFVTNSYNCHNQHLRDKVLTAVISSTSVTNSYNSHTQHLYGKFLQLS